MTLRSRVALVRGSYWPAVVLSMTAIALAGLGVGLEGARLFGATAGVAMVVTVAWRPVVRRLMQRLVLQHQARLDAALTDGDEEALRRYQEETDEYYVAFHARPERERLRLRSRVLAGEERYAEAAAILADVDRDALPPAERMLHDNQIAWCCAHGGETARAVELARGLVDGPADQRMRSYVLGTLGAALVLDRQYAAAQAPLRDALALGGARWALAVRHYYLGEALAGLGRLDEARAEWEKSVTIAPKSRWGRRAQERLVAAVPAAYR